MMSSPRARLIGRKTSGALVAALALGCGEGTSPPAPANVTVSPDIVIIDSIGGTVQFIADVRDARGAAISGASVTWSVSNPVVATIDANTGLATAITLGGTTVTARVAAVSDEATLEVFVPSATVFVAGETYFGRRQYIEYLAGDLPVIVSAPHGGNLEPAEISARTSGVTTRDLNTQELARAFASALFDRTGRRAHIIINRLHRNRLDANREIVEAAQGDVFGEWAWAEYHGFIEAAKQSVDEQYGSGLYIDLHGHGHDIQRLELGYLLAASDLELPDNLLDDPDLVNRSSIRALALAAAVGFVELVRGATSLGGLLAQEGFGATCTATKPESDHANPAGFEQAASIHHGAKMSDRTWQSERNVWCRSEGVAVLHE